MKDNKKKNMISKKQILITLVIVLLMLTLYGVYQYKTVYSNEKNIDVEEYIKNTKKYNGLEIDNINFYRKNTINYIEFQINNKNKELYKSKEVYLVFLDAFGKEISKSKIKIPDIEVKGNKKIKVKINKKDLKAYTFVLSDN